jgi:hypothetical protein
VAVVALPNIGLGEVVGGSVLRWLPVPETPPAWQVSDEELEDVEILWPSRMGWEPGWGWVSPLYYSLRRRVRVREVELPQFGEAGPLGLCVLIGGRAHDVGVSYSDNKDTDFDEASRFELLFKMQFRNEGYDEPWIVPGGYVADSLWIHGMVPTLRKVRDRQDFDHQVYGRFGMRFGADVRGRALEILTRQNRFGFTGGGKLINYREFLGEVARAGICIDLPGKGPFCFRLINYLGVGACTIAFPHAARLPVPLEDGVQIAYAREDMSNLVELCEYYLSHPEEREKMRVAAQQYYDAYLHPANLTSYYLRTMLDRLS